MKFRAKMTDSLAIRQFYNVLASMAKLSKIAVLRLAQEHFYFIAADTGVTGASIWCQMEHASFFTEYVLEGVTPEDPEIYLELHPMQMVQTLAVLKSSNTAIKSLKVKLSRKHGQACLSFVMEMMPSMRQCVHDIPVKPIPRKEWSDFSEPTYDVNSDDFVSLALPDVKKLKHITERYKNLGPYVRFEASQTGHLELKLISDKVTLSTHFKDLEVAKNKDAVISNAEPVLVSTDLKKLAMLLGADQIGPKRVVASFVREKLLHLCLLNDEISMQYYLPAISI